MCSFGIPPGNLGTPRRMEQKKTVRNPHERKDSAQLEISVLRYARMNVVIGRYPQGGTRDFFFARLFFGMVNVFHLNRDLLAPRKRRTTIDVCISVQILAPRSGWYRYRYCYVVNGWCGEMRSKQFSFKRIRAIDCLFVAPS